ncbi:hypothetical protein, partial [Pseudomonas gingeri]
APGWPKTVREPKDHSAIRSWEIYRADTDCQPVKTAPGALARVLDKLSIRILLCLMTEVLNGISVQRRFIQPH